MPSITIREIDLTTAEPAEINGNIVYVPGFATTGEVNKPVLCTTIEEFEKAFGSTPYIFAEAQAYPEDFDANAIPEEGVNIADAGDFDLSYLYAKELLALGLPVLYERVTEDDSIESFYKALPTAINALENKGEYEIKYITTGAYPAFELAITYEKTEERVIEPGSSENNGCVISVTAKEIKDFDNGTYPTTEIALWKNVTINDETISVTVMDPDGSIVSDAYYTRTDSDDKIAIELNGGDDASGFELKIGEYKVYIAAEVKVEVSSNIAQTMINVAATRGDAIALIDHTNNETRPLTGMNSVYYSASVLNPMANGEFGTMFTPWCNFTCGQAADFSSELDYELPGSFAYLTALARSIVTNASWIAVAGVTRGVVENISTKNPLCTEDLLTNVIAESYQPRNKISINPITNIKPYGYTIWGNRTLKNNAVQGDLTATSFLNLRNLVCDVKKEVFVACKRLMFEQNSDILWINFQAEVTPLLDRMKTGYGISNYKIIKVPTTQRGKLEAQIILYPIYAVEDFVVTVVLTDDEVTVE